MKAFRFVFRDEKRMEIVCRGEKIDTPGLYKFEIMIGQGSTQFIHDEYSEKSPAVYARFVNRISRELRYPPKKVVHLLRTMFTCLDLDSELLPYVKTYIDRVPKIVANLRRDPV